MALTCDEITNLVRQDRPERTVRRADYCKGILAAAAICEKPIKMLDGTITPASPGHAQMLRLFVEAHYVKDEQ